MDENTRALLVFALVGIVAGFLASIVVGGGGVLQYLVSGVIGAFVGGYLLRALGINLGNFKSARFTNRDVHNWRNYCRPSG